MLLGTPNESRHVIESTRFTVQTWLRVNQRDIASNGEGRNLIASTCISWFVFFIVGDSGALNITH